MTITRDQAQMLATLVCAARPIGARQWRAEDVMAELGKLRDRSLGSVICAATRAAMDRHAERPEVIASAGSHWSDTLIAADWVPNALPAEERCSTCSESRERCRRKWSADHEFLPAAIAKRAKTDSDPADVTRVVAALKDEVAHTDPADQPAPRGLDDLGDRNPRLKARVDELRAQLPEGLPMRENETAEPHGMRVLVTGSRDWEEDWFVHDALSEVESLRGTPGAPFVVVHGDCLSGADLQAAEWVDGWHGYPVEGGEYVTQERHPADWSRGRKAGPERNAAMVALGADLCLAFIGECTSPRCSKPEPHPSHGATGCADLAEQAGIPVVRFSPNDPAPARAIREALADAPAEPSSPEPTPDEVTAR